MRALMDLNGDEELKVWISEYGIPTTTSTERWSTRHTKPNSSRTY